MKEKMVVHTKSVFNLRSASIIAFLIMLIFKLSGWGDFAWAWIFLPVAIYFLSWIGIFCLGLLIGVLEFINEL